MSVSEALGYMMGLIDSLGARALLLAFIVVMITLSFFERLSNR